MGFSGGGSNITKAHTHDSTVVQDGGALAANVTQFGLSAGSILYSDGSNIQELGVGASGYVLGTATGTTPTWEAGAASPVMSVNGQMVYFDGSRTALDIGSQDDVLTVSAGGLPTWVAAAAAPVSTTFFSYNTTNFGGTSSTYFAAFPSGGNNVWGYTESEFVIPCNTDLTFTRYQLNIRGNAKASDQITAFRDDGSNVAPITVPASTTGTFDSGVVSVNIASGSLICWVYHATAAGNIDMYATLGTVTT